MSGAFVCLWALKEAAGWWFLCSWDLLWLYKQFLLGLIAPSGLKQPHLGWPMTSISVQLQVFTPAWAALRESVTLLSGHGQCCAWPVHWCASLALTPPQRGAWNPEPGLPTSLPCSLAGAMRWPWCSGPKAAAASPQCAPKCFEGKQQKCMSWLTPW